MRKEEIEQIVGSPMLFDTVKSQIEAERRRQNSKNVIGGTANFQVWNWQKVSAMTLLFFTVGVIGLIVFNKLSKPPQVERTAATEAQPKVEQNEIPFVSLPTHNSEDPTLFVKTKNPIIESSITTKQKVFVDKIQKIEKSAVRKPIRQQRFPRQQNERVGEFYALAGNPGEAGEELQIVRAELSRSSLFALGVNLPIENESERIKTDLLVGADGVARAIRLVKKTEN